MHERVLFAAARKMSSETKYLILLERRVYIALNFQNFVICVEIRIYPIV